MGTLRQFEPESYGCNVFFETGTGEGHSLLRALEAPCFEQLYSVEIAPETYANAMATYGAFEQLTLINSDSPSALREVLPVLRAADRVLFFLDAHFPGEVSSGFPGYTADIPERARLPLETELSVIAELRAGSRDVIIADDLRIYENGPFAHGNMPDWAETLPPERKNIDFVKRIFPNARIERDFRDEGYLLIHT